MVKSAVCEAPSHCCYDFDVDDQAYHSNWMKARAEWRKKVDKEGNLDSELEEVREIAEDKSGTKVHKISSSKHPDFVFCALGKI